MTEPKRLKVESYSADVEITPVLKRYAKEYGRSVSEVTRLAIELGLRQMEQSRRETGLKLAARGQRTSLGRFKVTGDVGQVHQCTGPCNKVLYFKSFPLPRGGKESGLRVTECCDCRDRRLGRK